MSVTEYWKNICLEKSAIRELHSKTDILTYVARAEWRMCWFVWSENGESEVSISNDIWASVTINNRTIV